MKVLPRYLKFFGTLTGTFVLVVACGAEKYRLPVDGEDTSENKTATTQTTSGQATVQIMGIHAPQGWPSRPISFLLDKKLSAQQQGALKEAAGIWEAAVGYKLFVFAGFDSKSGDDFFDLYSSLDDYLNACYIDYNWQKTGKVTEILATTIWYNTEDEEGISTADLRMNGQLYAFDDSDTAKQKNKTLVDSLSVSLHEIGHLLGLAHVDETTDPASVMNPTLFVGEGLHNRVLSSGDIARIRTIYP